jgi:hypothetical protein
LFNIYIMDAAFPVSFVAYGRSRQSKHERSLLIFVNCYGRIRTPVQLIPKETAFLDKINMLAAPCVFPSGQDYVIALRGCLVIKNDKGNKLLFPFPNRGGSINSNKSGGSLWLLVSSNTAPIRPSADEIIDNKYTWACNRNQRMHCKSEGCSNDAWILTVNLD